MKCHLEQPPPFAHARAFVVQCGRETAVDAGRMITWMASTVGGLNISE